MLCAQLIINMHSRVELQPEPRAMDVEASESSEGSDSEAGVSDQNSVANMVIRLFNKKAS